MALRATSALEADPDSAARPLKKTAFTFSVELVDRLSPQATKRTLQLRLAASNDLQFSDGSKTAEFEETIGRNPVPLEFDVSITGAGTDIALFLVTLVEAPSNKLAACFVGLV